MKTVTSQQREVLDKELDSLLKWGERHGQDVNDPDREVRPVRRVYEIAGKPSEIYVDQKVWPLENANQELLPELDQRIVSSYKLLKGSGFERPSIVLFIAYFRYIHLNDNGDKYARNPKAWCGAMLVSQRLESTCRIAVRYEFPDRFGPKVTEKDGSIYMEYTKDAWRPALIRRGVIPQKKGDVDGSRRTKDNRGEVRPVSKPVGDKKGSEKKGRNKGARDVSGTVSGESGGEVAGSLQQDLFTLPETPYDTGRKNGVRGSNKRRKRT